MSLLSNVTVGPQKKPLFTVVYGPEGVGKSSFAAAAPKPIFDDIENGTSNLNVARLPKSKNFGEVMAAVKALQDEKHSYESYVLDSLTSLETMIVTAVCELDGSKTINQAQGGFGNGQKMAISYWDRYLKALGVLRDNKNMNVILIGHSHVKPFYAPELGLSYDRYNLKLDKDAGDFWKRNSDAVLFCNFEVMATKEKSEKKAKTIGDGERKIFTEFRPSFDAKNRIGLPYEMPLSWDIFVSSVGTVVPKAPEPPKVESIEEVKADLEKLSVRIENKETVTKMMEAVTKASGDLTKLISIRNHARDIAGLNA